jgi:uncharacterized repeat protein (TIGR01451 family)
MEKGRLAMPTTHRTSLLLLVILITSMLSLYPAPATPPAHAAPISENENSDESGFNDVAGDAQALASIGLDSPVQAAIGQPGDIDWFAFDAVAGQRYAVELFEVNSSLGTLSGFTCGVSRSGIWPAIYDMNENRIVDLCNNNAGGVVEKVLPFTASANGTFYVRVEAHSDSVAGSYSMRILPKYGEPGAAWDETTFEPNNAFINAYEIQPGKDNALTSTIEAHDPAFYSEQADVDWYRFEAEPNHTYTIELFNVAASLASDSGYNCGVSRDGLWMEVYDNALFSNIQADEIEKECDTTWGVNVHTSIVLPEASGGTLFIRVTPHADTVAGNYSIRVLPRYDEPGAAWDPQTFEPNNRSRNAYEIIPGVTHALRSTIEAADTRYSTEYADKDWYRFNAEAGLSYSIEVFDVDGSLLEDSGYNCNVTRSGLWLELLGPSFNSIAKECNNEGTNYFHTWIQLDTPSNGIYHFSVMPGANTVSGDYSVRVRPLYCNNVTEINQTSCETLVTLYETLDGDNWTSREGWLDTNTPCSWDGVECTAGQITGLDLSTNNLNGTLPSDISNLNNLTSLELDGNPDLSGELPSEMTRIANLERFRFTDTGLCEQGDEAFQTWLDDIREADRAPLCDATINLTKGVSASTARPGDTLTYSIVVDGGGAATEVEITDTLPAGLTYVENSVTGGASYESGSRQLSYTGIVSATQAVTITYQATVNADVADGTIIANTARASSADLVLEENVSVSVANPEQINTLVLLYYGADNNLAQDGLNVLNSAERAADNPNTVVLMMLDGPGVKDAYLYLLQPDTADENCPTYTNPTCDGRYVLGQTIWEWPDLTADAVTLADFISGALLAYPNADQVMLSIIGHGSGISAAGLADQPGSRRNRRFDPLAGLLLDESPTESSLSTRSLGDALREGLARAQDGGVSRNQIDGLYLDACLMSMVEVAYEIRDSVGYMLASPNIKWSVADYDLHISAIDGQRNARQILEAWMTSEAELLADYDHPYTYAVADLSQIDALHTALSDLATALIATLPTAEAQIRAAFEASDFFDANGDNELSSASDTYVDIGSLVQNIASQFSTNIAVQDAVDGVDAALAQVVVARDHLDGIPYTAPETEWSWDTYSGLSIYAPLAEDGWQRRYYTGRHFQAADAGQWDEFLTAYWGGEAPAVPGSPGRPQPRSIPNLTEEPEAVTVGIQAVASTVAEDAGAATFTITRTGDLAASLVVSYTVGGSATSGADYAPVTGNITIPANNDQATLSIDIIDDADVESDETLVVTLTVDDGYIIATPPEATVTLVDNDQATPTEQVIYLPLVQR